MAIIAKIQYTIPGTNKSKNLNHTWTKTGVVIVIIITKTYNEFDSTHLILITSLPKMSTICSPLSVLLTQFDQRKNALWLQYCTV